MEQCENREKLVQFVAQEVKNDGRIPHFAPDALDEIIMEAKRRSGKQKRPFNQKSLMLAFETRDKHDLYMNLR